MSAAGFNNRIVPISHPCCAQYKNSFTLSCQFLTSSKSKSNVEKENPLLYPDGWKEMDGIFLNPKNSPLYKNDEITDILLGFKPLNVGDYVKQ